MPTATQSTAPTPTTVPKDILVSVASNGQQVFFKRTSNNGVDAQNRIGSCGYIALGTTREIVQKDLSDHIGNEDVRRYIGAQIENDYITARAALRLSNEHMQALKDLRNAYNYYQNERNQLIHQYGILLQLIEPNEKDIIEACQKDPRLNEHAVTYIEAELMQARAAQDNSKQLLKEFIRSEEVVQDYIDQNIPSEWMGDNVALAWGCATGKNIAIWAHNDPSNPNIIAPRHNHISAQGQPIIHILHTGHNTHYERLHIYKPEHDLHLTHKAETTRAPSADMKHKQPTITPAQLNNVAMLWVQAVEYICKRVVEFVQNIVKIFSHPASLVKKSSLPIERPQEPQLNADTITPTPIRQHDSQYWRNLTSPEQSKAKISLGK